MDQSPLVTALIDAGVRFLEAFDKTYPVAIAFWSKVRDERRWYLHIASEQIRAGGVTDAYGEVLRIAGQLKDVSFDPFNVKLRTMDEKIVQFALDFQRRHPGMAAVFDVPSFYLVEVEGMYIYPPLKTAAA